MARRWVSFAREAARTAAYFVLFGFIAYFGMKVVIKIEATQTRLFLVCVVFGVAFSATVLLDYLWRDRVPADTQPNCESKEIWPRWHSQFSEPIVNRHSERVPYSYVVLPRPS